MNFEHFKEYFHEGHVKIIHFFRKYYFGSNNPILTYFSILDPSDRCVILEQLQNPYQLNSILNDKLLLAYVASGHIEFARKVIDHAFSLGESEENIYGLIDKLDLPRAPKRTGEERISIYRDFLLKSKDSLEIEFLNLAIDFCKNYYVMELYSENWRAPQPTENLREVLQLDDMIHSGIDSDVLYSRYAQYGDYPHPHILYKFGVSFLIKRDFDTAKEALLKGASFGLQYPLSMYENPLIDSIGQCLAHLVTKFPSRNNSISLKATQLSYLYLSKCVEISSRTTYTAYDSFRTRAILFIDHENKMAVHELIMSNLGGSILIDPFIISDFYFASRAEDSPHQGALENAREIHKKLGNISIGGKYADSYTLEEMALLGARRHVRLFGEVEKRYRKGELNLTFAELKSCF